jgi:hypothetical protein
MVTAKILNKLSRIRDGGWGCPPALGLNVGLTIHRRNKIRMLQNVIYKVGSLKTAIPRGRWGNIDMDLKGIRCEYMNWINLAQDRDQWWHLVNTIMNLHVP